MTAVTVKSTVTIKAEEVVMADGEGELDELDEGRPCGTREWHRLHAGVSSQAEVVVGRLLLDVGHG